jgi:hypothetical protein
MALPVPADYILSKIGECPSLEARLRTIKHDVFLCYSTEDLSIAYKVCCALESRGIRCWVAPRDIQLGQEWRAAIAQGLESCRIMVLIYSANSNKSIEVLREVKQAADMALDIIPFRLEDVPPSRSLEYFVRLCRWIEARPPIESHFSRLAETIHNMLAPFRHPGEGKSAASPGAGPMPEQRGFPS